MQKRIDFKSIGWVRSVARARSLPCKIKCGAAWSSFACYRVASRNPKKAFGARDGYYTVCLSVWNSQRVGSCTCLGFLNGSLCWHIAAAVLYHAALVAAGVRPCLLENKKGAASAVPFFLLRFAVCARVRVFSIVAIRAKFRALPTLKQVCLF